MYSLNSLSNDERDAYATIEAALLDQPLAKAPAGLAAGVLMRVKKHPRSSLPVRPAFRLTWMDVLLCGTLSGMMGTIFFVWHVMASAPMAPVRAILRSQGLILRQQVLFVPEMQSIWLFAFAGLGIGLACLWGLSRAGLFSR